MRYAVIDPVTGVVVVSGTSKNPPEGSVPVPRSVDKPPYWMVTNPEEQAHENLQWVPRPELEGLEPSPNIRVTGAPAGTFALVHDMCGRELMGRVEAVDGNIEIDLMDTGIYEVEFRPPLPWVSRSVLVEV